MELIRCQRDKHLDEMIATDHKMWHINTGKPGKGITKKEIVDLENKDYVIKVVLENDKMLGFVIYKMFRHKYEIAYLCLTTGESGKLILDRMKAKMDFGKRTLIETMVNEKLTVLHKILAFNDFKSKLVRKAFGESDGLSFTYDLGDNNVE